MLQQNYSFYSFKLKDFIWKLKLHSQKAVVFVETRSAEDRKVVFQALDLEEKKMIWQREDLDNAWWKGMEVFASGNLLLHGYADLDSPVHKGITVLHSETGELLWEKPEYCFFEESCNGLILQKWDNTNEKLLVNPLNGNTTEMYNHRAMPTEHEELKSIMPVQVMAENPAFCKIANYVVQCTGEMPVLALDYLEYTDHLIIAFYTFKNDCLLLHLLLVNETGEVQFCEKLEKNLKGIGKDAFFVFHHKVIAIRNRSELLILDL